MTTNDKVTLVICDGMGLSPEPNGNAILGSATPTFDYLLQNYPSMRLLAAGTEVGLDMGEPGNSEVGHLTIGTGQVLPQAFQIINTSIKNETYKKNKAFLTAIESAKKAEVTLHLVGLVSAGGVHGHIDHMLALLELAKEKGVKRVAVHAITDGRDSPPKSVQNDIKPLLEALKDFDAGVIATVGGRFYAMDRDKTWERTDTYYWAMLGRAKEAASTIEAAVEAGYKRGESDENLQPAVLTDAEGQPVAPLKKDDVVIITNYRPDRIRQLATRLIMTNDPLSIVMMTDYFLAAPPTGASTETKVASAYPLPKPTDTLAEVLAHHHKTQLHIAETEKYAHITYFFNGHEETKQSGEEWLLVPSVKVKSFDQAPEMSAKAVTAAYLDAKKNHRYDFITINYANMDMVGHTGDFAATKKAVAYVDAELRALVSLVEQSGEWLLITADHGNAEQKINSITGEIDKEHTTNPVPLILVHPDLKRARGMDKSQLATMSEVGMLADVAPTILDIMKIKRPTHMAGASWLKQLSR